MKKTIKLPAPQLSWLKEVNIDLEMTGRHYALLSSCENMLPEDVALSILKDLIEEDANKLTLSELRYLFMMVKINSLEGNYTANIECSHITKNKKICGALNQVKVSLSETDLHPTPADYEVPTIKFRYNDTEKEYKVIPPTINKISALYDYFITQKNANQEKILEDKTLSFDFAFIQALLHLVDFQGNCLIPDDTYNFDTYIDTGLCEDNRTPKPTVLNINKMSTITKLLELVTEVDSYGVQPTTVDINCKECGGRLIVQIPLLHGLID